jgi:hypothetical protein
MTAIEAAASGRVIRRGEAQSSARCDQPRPGDVGQPYLGTVKADTPAPDTGASPVPTIYDGSRRGRRHGKVKSAYAPDVVRGCLAEAKQNLVRPNCPQQKPRSMDRGDEARDRRF